MSRCSICGNVQREAIDTALASGTPLRAIAASYGVTKSALARHRSHLGRTPTLAPMRTRTRTRPAIAPSARHDQQAGDCDADAASDAIVPELVTGDDVPADEARLREVVRMGLSGMTQDQIAGRFHVTARTIRRWQVHARQKRLDRFRATTPDDMLSSMLDRLAMIEAEAITMQDAAIAAGSMKIAIEALRQRRAVIRDTSLIGERVGLFENFKFVPPASDDPAAMLADQMRQGIGELLALFAPGTAPADVATDTLDTAPADAPMPDTA